jgi:GGDEF domain-containing protein
MPEDKHNTGAPEEVIYGPVDRREGQRGSNPADLPRDGDIMYKQELGKMLNEFGDPKGRFEDIKAIWAEEGFVDPKELSKKLLDKMVSTPQEHTLLNHILDNSSEKDKLSGFDAQPHVSLLTGLAHLYGQTQGQKDENPILMVDADGSNMGNTNKHFVKLIVEAAQEEISSGKYNESARKIIGDDKVLVAEYDALIEKFTGDKDFASLNPKGQLKKIASGANPEWGHNGTDVATRVSANIMKEDIEAAGGKVFAARAGGDEFRYIVTGLSAEKMEKTLDTAHDRIEKFTAKAGLHDHPHSKDPLNPYRNGFGFVAKEVNLSDPDLNPANAVARNDAGVEAKKIVIGHERHGEVAHLEGFLNNVRDALAITSGSTSMTDEKIESVVNAIAEQKVAPAQEKGERYAQLKGGVNSTAAVIDVLESAEYKDKSRVNVQNNQMDLGVDVVREPFENPAVTSKKQVNAMYGDTKISSLEAYRAILAALDGHKSVDSSSKAAGKRDFAKTTAMILDDSLALAKTHPDLALDKPRVATFESDNFATLNTLYGHQVADKVLVERKEAIDEVMDKHGFKDTDYTLTRVDASVFKVVIPPAVKDEKTGEWKAVREDDVKAFVEDVKAKLDEKVPERGVLEYYKEKSGEDLSVKSDANGNLITEETKLKDLPHNKLTDTEKGMGTKVFIDELEAGKHVGNQLKSHDKRRNTEIDAEREVKLDAFEKENGYEPRGRVQQNDRKALAGERQPLDGRVNDAIPGNTSRGPDDEGKRAFDPSLEGQIVKAQIIGGAVDRTFDPEIYSLGVKKAIEEALSGNEKVLEALSGIGYGDKGGENLPTSRAKAIKQQENVPGDKSDSHKR